jgi:DNA-binding MarR family transcriptional regulator
MKKDKNLFNGITQKQAEEIANGITDKLNLAEGTGISVNLSRKKIPIPDYTMLFQAVGLQVTKILKPSSLCVFYHFLCKLQYSNHIGVDQNTIAEELELSVITVKRAIKELKDNKIIIDYKDQQDNRRNVYIINPEVAWRGSAAGRIKTLRKIEADNKNQMKLFNNKENS